MHWRKYQPLLLKILIHKLQIGCNNVFLIWLFTMRMDVFSQHQIAAVILLALLIRKKEILRKRYLTGLSTAILLRLLRCEASLPWQAGLMILERQWPKQSYVRQKRKWEQEKLKI